MALFRFTLDPGEARLYSVAPTFLNSLGVLVLSQEIRFVAMFDVHYGKERLSTRHYKPIHSMRAIEPIFKFMEDFKPNAFVFGGDQLDLGEISHWNKSKRLSLEGLRLIDSVQGFRREILDPVDKLLPPGAIKRYHLGNHEDWLQDLLEENPALEGCIDLDELLGLSVRNWRTIPMEQASKLGKLFFVHGHQVKGGEHVAKAAVAHFARSIRFGHHHTFQAFTTTSALDAHDVHTGIAVPCLCRRDLKYGEGKPNRWVNGFLWGTIFPDGSFTDTVTLIHDGRFYANGKTYKA